MNWNKRMEDGRTVLEHNIEIHENAKREAAREKGYSDGGYTRGEDVEHNGNQGRRVYCYNLSSGEKVIAAAKSVGGGLVHDTSPMPLSCGFSVFLPNEN